MLSRLFVAVLTLLVMSTGLFAAEKPTDALQKAVQKGQAAILIVTDSAAQGLDQARGVAREAAKKINGCVTVEMNRSDAANAPFVAKYGLAGAPMPLILVFAKNGAIVGGLPAAQATPEMLVKSFPSAKKAEVLKAIQDGNAVLLVAASKSMKERAKVMENCAAACNKIKGKAATVQIGLDDPAEQDFLKELKVDPASKEPVTLVVNTQGQLAGSFTGPVEVGKLAELAIKKGGCCGSGSKAACPLPPTK